MTILIAGLLIFMAAHSVRIVAVVLGIGAWFVFARYLHAWLIGVHPFA